MNVENLSFVALPLLVSVLVIWERARPTLLRAVAEVRAVWEIYRARVERRRFIVEHEKHLATLKAKIVGVGPAQLLPGGQCSLGDGWLFDCSNGTPVHRMGADGLMRYCGYTSAELHEISLRPAEYVSRAGAE